MLYRTCSHSSRRQRQLPLARGRGREAQGSQVVAARSIHVNVGVGPRAPSLGARDRVHVSRRAPIEEHAGGLAVADEDTCTGPHIQLVAVADKNADKNVAVAEDADPGQEPRYREGSRKGKKRKERECLATATHMSPGGKGGRVPAMKVSVP